MSYIATLEIAKNAAKNKHENTAMILYFQLF